MLTGRRRQVLRAGAGVAAAALLAGCSATGSSGSSSSASTVTAKGTTLVIYLSQPPAADPVQKQVFQAEQLGCQQLAGSIPGSSLSLKCQTASGRQLSDNARTAIQDESSIAYVGEIEPGSSEQTIGITEALDLLQVSPTDTAPTLDSYYEALSTYGRTFARIVPTSAQEATAQVQEMKALRVRSVYVTGDGSDYGKALAAAVRSDLSAQGLTATASASGADAIFYAGNSPTAANRFASSTSASASSARLFLPSALAGLDFSAGSWSRFRGVYVSEPGVTGAAERSFVSQFHSRFGQAPAPEAAYGYAAIQALVQAIKTAGKSAANRTTVVRDFHKLSGFSSVVGTLSINSSGDSSLGPGAFTFSRLHGGSLVPVR